MGEGGHSCWLAWVADILLGLWFQFRLLHFPSNAPGRAAEAQENPLKFLAPGFELDQIQLWLLQSFEE